MELYLGRWSVEAASKAGLIEFKDHLQGPAEDEEETAFEPANAPPQSKIFVRSQSQGKHRNDLEFRKKALIWKGGKKRVRTPLFGGWLSFRAETSSPHGTLFQSLCCKLNLNLQRFIRYQPVTDKPSLAHRNWRLENVRWRERESKRCEYGDEFSYDGNDNWTPSTLNWRAFARSDEGEFHLTNLIQVVNSQIHKELKRALKHTSKASDVHVYERQEYHAFTVIETGWEFASRNPIDDVVFYGERFMHINKKAGRARLNRIASRAREKNSPCYEFPIKGGAVLKLYAKTNKRIRFEVVLRMEKDLRAKMLKMIEVVPHPSDKGVVDYRPDDELYKTITAARKYASVQLNDFMAEYRQNYGSAPRPFSAAEFLSAVAGAMPPEIGEVERADLLGTMISKLILHQGWFAAVPKGAMAKVFAKLKKAGVLKHEQKRQCYIIGHKYRAAVNALRSITGETSLALLGRRRGIRPIRDR